MTTRPESRASFKSEPSGLIRLIVQSSRICWALASRSSMALMTTPTTRWFGDRIALLRSSPTAPRAPSVTSFLWNSTGGYFLSQQCFRCGFASKFRFSTAASPLSIFPDRRLAREKCVTLGTVAMTGCGGRRLIQRRLEPVLLPDVVEKFVADGPTHAVEDDQQHPILRLHDLDDDLRDHILDRKTPSESEPTEVQSASALAKSRLNSSLRSRIALIELLIGLGQSGTSSPRQIDSRAQSTNASSCR